MIIYFMANNKPQDYVDPKKLDSLEWIISFNVPENLTKDVLNSVNTSVNKLLAADFNNRFHLLLEQVELYNLTKEKFLSKISYYIIYISSKNLFDSSEMPKVLNDLYAQLISNSDVDNEDYIESSNINKIYDDNIKRLKFLAGELKGIIISNKSVILNKFYKDKSYSDRLFMFTESEIYKNTTYEDFKNDPIEFLDQVRQLHMFDALELTSVIDHFIYVLIDKINDYKSLDIKKESE